VIGDEKRHPKRINVDWNINRGWHVLIPTYRSVYCHVRNAMHVMSDANKSFHNDNTNRVGNLGICLLERGNPMNKIIDADELQKKISAPYQYHGMTIQEVHIGNPVQITVFRKNGSPCDESCIEYRRGDCVGELWMCRAYQKFRSE
jgi:hypothetical protein